MFGGIFWDSCKFAPTLVELDEREWERSWVGWGCLCRGAMGRREFVCSSFVRAGTATASHQTLDVMERVQFQQEQVRSVL
jgi:hypothetical protein